MADSAGRRVIEVGKKIIGPTKPREKRVQVRAIGDYPAVSRAHLDVAQRLSSPALMGPPICDELIAFVQHVFTEEEASLVRHLGTFRGRTADDLARRERRPIEEVRPILHQVAVVKRAVASSGPEGREKYRLMPVVPGIFEMVLISESPETISPWHRRFAELFEALYETGYSIDYALPQGKLAPVVRYLPVGKAIEAHPMALPSDKLEVVLDRFDVFAVGQCQCRLAMHVTGRGCGKPMENCAVIGDWASQGIEQGFLRQVSKQEMLDIKREAEAHGMVNWMMNVESTKGQSSCSCCGCCCHAMRGINEFNAPGMIAPPHFLPEFNDQCTYCGRCARQCPMGALAIDMGGKTRQHKLERCIGCGVCAVACGERGAITMEPVPDYRLPYKSWFAMLLGTAPAMARTAWRVWRSRG